MDRWIDGRVLDGITVQRHELPRPGGKAYIPLAQSTAIVVHTTEGSTVDVALATLGANSDGPTFVVGEGRIVQTRPLDVQAATLRDNTASTGSAFHPNALGWQIESVGSSKRTVGAYMLPPATTRPLVAVCAYLAETFDVPLRRPAGWVDSMADCPQPWAADNLRRQQRKAVGFGGFLGHVDVPDQGPTWHFDPGPLDYSTLFGRIGELMAAALDSYIAGGDACAKAYHDGGGRDPGAAPANLDKYGTAGWRQTRQGLVHPTGGGGGVSQTVFDAHAHPLGNTGKPI